MAALILATILLRHAPVKVTSVLGLFFIFRGLFWFRYIGRPI